MHESGGIPLILNLVMSDFPVIQHLALKTLQILTTDKENCITFREAQGFEKLMDILNNAVGVAWQCRCDSSRMLDQGLKAAELG